MCIVHLKGKVVCILCAWWMKLLILSKTDFKRPEVFYYQRFATFCPCSLGLDNPRFLRLVTPPPFFLMNNVFHTSNNKGGVTVRGVSDANTT